MQNEATISQAIGALFQQVTGKQLHKGTTLEDLDNLAAAVGVDTHDLLAQACTLSYRHNAAFAPRAFRQALSFGTVANRATKTLVYTRDPKDQFALDPAGVHDTVLKVNRTLELLNDMAMIYGVPIFELLGLRNLSSFVGEIFAREFFTRSQGAFVQNPNQDGYPDLLALTKTGKKYIDEIFAAGRQSEKELWSPYPYGGIEVKATCGNTPAASIVAKPKIGESRYPILKDAEWKAHHRLTNNLLAIHWDFIDALPTIVACFFRNDLTEADWGKIVQPSEEGGRTTSVSLMVKRRNDATVGVAKMGRGCIVLCTEPTIRTKLASVYSIAQPMLGTI